MSKSFYKVFPLKNKKAFAFANDNGLLLKSRFFLIVVKNIPENMIHNILNLPQEVIYRRKLQSYVRFLGIKATRKIGNAVERNLIKRRIRTVFYEYCKKISNNFNSFTLIVIPSKACLYAKQSDVQNNFEYLLNKFIRV